MAEEDPGLGGDVAGHYVSVVSSCVSSGDSNRRQARQRTPVTLQ